MVILSRLSGTESTNACSWEALVTSILREIRIQQNCTTQTPKVSRYNIALLQADNSTQRGAKQSYGEGQATPRPAPCGVKDPGKNGRDKGVGGTSIGHGAGKGRMGGINTDLHHVVSVHKSLWRVTRPLDDCDESQKMASCHSENPLCLCLGLVAVRVMELVGVIVILAFHEQWSMVTYGPPLQMKKFEYSCAGYPLTVETRHGCTVHLIKAATAVKKSEGVAPKIVTRCPINSPRLLHCTNAQAKATNSTR